MAELGLKDCPWFSQGNKLPVFTSFHFEIFCPFQTPFYARDGTAQVERLASEPTWVAAVKTLSNFWTVALETTEKNHVGVGGF
jgi:hypothetical protein